MLENTDFNFDLDGDGILDSYAAQADLDGDGFTETLLVDLNGDGIEDAMLQEIDFNGDGLTDTIQVSTDSDGNGVFDTFSTVFDVNGDGVMESYVNNYDADGDGITDYSEGNWLIDADGDSQFDTFIHGIDENADGVIDIFDQYDYDDSPDDDLNFDTFDMDDDTNGGLFAEDLDNFDPSEANPDDVYGDPDDSMAEWEFQGDTNRCALYSQKFVIDEMTGEDIDIEKIADLAEENGWFTEEGGTNLSDMNKILDYFGIENEMSYGNDLNDLVNCLEGGGKAIVSIDADEIWYGENDDIFTPGDGPNHAVEVIGIDNSDPDNPMVILNDSGNPNGCGEMVPADVFMDAWEDGDFHMIDIPEV